MKIKDAKDVLLELYSTSADCSNEVIIGTDLFHRSKNYEIQY